MPSITSRPPRVHPCVRSGRRGLPPADGLERRRLARRGRGVRGVVADAEGAHHRAPARRASCRRRLSGADRARLGDWFARSCSVRASPRRRRSSLRSIAHGSCSAATKYSTNVPSATRQAPTRSSAGASRPVPQPGEELDESILPAEAGLEKRTSLRERLLPGPGTNRASALPRQSEPPSAHPRRRRRSSPRATSSSSTRRRLDGSRARSTASPSAMCAESPRPR